MSREQLLKKALYAPSVSLSVFEANKCHVYVNISRIFAVAAQIGTEGNYKATIIHFTV